MALFNRSAPEGVRARLERGERVLTYAPVAAPAGETGLAGKTGSAERADCADKTGLAGKNGPAPALVATTRALYLPDGRAVPWQDIDRARWTPDTFAFLEEGSGEHTVRLRSDPADDSVDYRRLAETVAERVTATILVNRFVPFPTTESATGFRLVARRPPGGTDADWRVHLGEGVDPKDPRLSDAVSRALNTLHDQMGI